MDYSRTSTDHFITGVFKQSGEKESLIIELNFINLKSFFVLAFFLEKFYTIKYCHKYLIIKQSFQYNSTCQKCSTCALHKKVLVVQYLDTYCAFMLECLSFVFSLCLHVQDSDSNMRYGGPEISKKFNWNLF